MIGGGVKIVWYAPQWQAAIVPAINRGLTAAAAVAANQAVVNFGTEGGGVKVGKEVANAIMDLKKYRALAVKMKGKQRYVAAPPGKFPGVRTSMLRNSVTFVSPEGLGTNGRAAFGTAVQYGRYLEFGTSKMQARPWIMRSAMQARSAMSRVFTTTTAGELKKAGLVK